MRTIAFSVGTIVIVSSWCNGLLRAHEDVRQIDTANRCIDLSHVHVDAFAKALGGDPQRILRLRPRRHSLRAIRRLLARARGALLSLSGNSLDRALLLQGLLEASGVRTRLKQGVLSPGQIDRLIEGVFPKRKPSEQKPQPVSDGSHLTPIEVALQAVHTHLKKSPSLEPATPLPDEIARESQRHVWVQFQKDGQWIDADPIFPDSKLGESGTPESQPADELPQSLACQVQLQILIRGPGQSEKSARQSTLGTELPRSWPESLS